MADLSGLGTGSPAPQPEKTAAYRGLLAAVIILGILILIGLGALVVGFATRFRGGGSHGQPAGPAAAQFTLASDTRIVGMDVATDRLVLRLRGPAGDEVDVIDTQSGHLVAKIRSAAPPRK